MGLGASIVIFAIGAILAFAVEVESPGIDLNTVGVILMIVGLIGALLSALFWSSWSPYGSYRRSVVRERPVERVRETRDYIE